MPKERHTRFYESPRRGYNYDSSRQRSPLAEMDGSRRLPSAMIMRGTFIVDSFGDPEAFNFMRNRAENAGYFSRISDAFSSISDRVIGRRDPSPSRSRSQYRSSRTTDRHESPERRRRDGRREDSALRGNRDFSNERRSRWDERPRSRSPRRNGTRHASSERPRNERSDEATQILNQHTPQLPRAPIQHDALSREQAPAPAFIQNNIADRHYDLPQDYIQGPQQQHYLPAQNQNANNVALQQNQQYVGNNSIPSIRNMYHPPEMHQAFGHEPQNIMPLTGYDQQPPIPQQGNQQWPFVAQNQPQQMASTFAPSENPGPSNIQASSTGQPPQKITPPRINPNITLNANALGQPWVNINQRDPRRILSPTLSRIQEDIRKRIINNMECSPASSTATQGSSNALHELIDEIIEEQEADVDNLEINKAANYFENVNLASIPSKSSHSEAEIPPEDQPQAAGNQQAAAIDGDQSGPSNVQCMQIKEEVDIAAQVIIENQEGMEAPVHDSQEERDRPALIDAMVNQGRLQMQVQANESGNNQDNNNNEDEEENYYKFYSKSKRNVFMIPRSKE